MGKLLGPFTERTTKRLRKRLGFYGKGGKLTGRVLYRRSLRDPLVPFTEKDDPEAYGKAGPHQGWLLTEGGKVLYRSF